MSKWDVRRTRQFPCDGVARYRSKKHDVGLMTYSEAWKDVVATSDCNQGEGKITFSKDAIRRLGNLNTAYIGVARGFIEEVFRQQAAAQILAKKKADDAKAAAQSIESQTEPIKEPC